GGGADPHLVGRFSNAHTSSPDASLPRPFRVMRGHSRSRAARRRAPAATLRHSPAPSSHGAVRLTQGMDGAREEWRPSARPRPAWRGPRRAASLAQPVYRLPRGGGIVPYGNALPEPHAETDRSSSAYVVGPIPLAHCTAYVLDHRGWIFCRKD